MIWFVPPCVVFIFHLLFLFWGFFLHSHIRKRKERTWTIRAYMSWESFGYSGHGLRVLAFRTLPFFFRLKTDTGFWLTAWSRRDWALGVLVRFFFFLFFFLFFFFFFFFKRSPLLACAQHLVMLLAYGDRIYCLHILIRIPLPKAWRGCWDHFCVQGN